MNCQEYISSFCIGIKLSKMYAGNGNMHR
jgi:hypothetical protein